MVGNGGCFCRKICYNSVILFEGEPDLKLSRLVFPPDGASRGTLRAHRAYLAVLLTLLGVGIGFLGLWLTACADAALPQAELYRSYLDHPLLLALNVLPFVLFALLLWRGVTLAAHAPDRFGALLVVGFVVQVALQAVLNVAVVTNTIPNTGISLPFFSSGGTSLMMLLGEMGIVLSVSRQTDAV